MLNGTITGHLGNDATLAYTQSGAPVLNFSLASNRRYNDGEGKPQTEVTWVRCTIWGPLAESIKPHLVKGKGVTVAFKRMKPSAFVGNDGKPAASIEVTVDEIELGDGNRQSASNGQPGEDAGADTNDIPF